MESSFITALMAFLNIFMTLNLSVQSLDYYMIIKAMNKKILGTIFIWIVFCISCQSYFYTIKIIFQIFMTLLIFTHTLL